MFNARQGLKAAPPSPPLPSSSPLTLSPAGCPPQPRRLSHAPSTCPGAAQPHLLRKLAPDSLSPGALAHTHSHSHTLAHTPLVLSKVPVYSLRPPHAEEAQGLSSGKEGASLGRAGRGGEGWGQTPAPGRGHSRHTWRAVVEGVKSACSASLRPLTTGWAPLKPGGKFELHLWPKPPVHAVLVLQRPFTLFPPLKTSDIFYNKIL